MNVVENILAMVILVTLFLAAFFMITAQNISFTEQTVQKTMRQFNQEKMSSDFDAVLNLSEEDSNKLLLNLIGDSVLYRSHVLAFGQTDVDVHGKVKEVLDEMYNEDNYYFRAVPQINELELVFVFDGSLSMKDEVVTLAATIPSIIGRLEQKFEIVSASVHILDNEELNAAIGDDTNNTPCGLFQDSNISCLPIYASEMYSVMKGYWKFDESSGDIANDFSGGNTTGTLKNWGAGDEKWVQGQDENALSFDGVNDYVDLGTGFSPGFDDWTVALWFNWGGGSGQNILYNKEKLYEAKIEDPGNGIGEIWYAWQPYWAWGNPVATVNRNEWHHLAITYNKQQQTVYLDSHLVYQRNQSGAMGSGNTKFLIGDRTDSGSYNFDGIIDEVLVYGVALSETEVRQIFLDGISGVETNVRGGGFSDPGGTFFEDWGNATASVATGVLPNFSKITLVVPISDELSTGSESESCEDLVAQAVTVCMKCNLECPKDKSFGTVNNAISQLEKTGVIAMPILANPCGYDATDPVNNWDCVTALGGADFGTTNCYNSAACEACTINPATGLGCEKQFCVDDVNGVEDQMAALAGSIGSLIHLQDVAQMDELITEAVDSIIQNMSLTAGEQRDEERTVIRRLIPVAEGLFIETYLWRYDTGG